MSRDVQEYGGGVLPAHAAARPGGLDACSTAELLATVLRGERPGTRAVRAAERLLAAHGGLAGLAEATAVSEDDVRSLPQRTARTVAAALELGRRLLLEPPSAPLRISAPGDIGPRLVAEMAALEQESMRVILLNTKHHVLAIRTVLVGGIDQILVHPRDIFREAVRRNATAVIVAHNHPSSDPTPSPEDIAVTRTLVDAGVVLGIELLDHLVIARGGYVSLRERRLGFASSAVGAS